ncbi:DNA/RNA non-specific endonuclease [Bengtsoniella intestinalis]|uniref:DNA/RNA non-specific endonuclease n=1 Tax=Bengtsoniella intestinalis TaxID=3073143 RepID=UPI00391F3147
MAATIYLQPETTTSTSTLVDLPAYEGAPYIYLDDNVPTFTEEDWTTTSFEYYSELDYLGRCGVVYACISTDLMPTEDRESISSVYPTGWVQGAYDNVDGGYLYNRSHLIGFQLTGENANELNLITGTRAFNVEGMLPFENEVAAYIDETGNHVLYRVTPYFDGQNLVANGVQMEAYSVEDNGAGVQFNVYCYNAQPDIAIDYATGSNYYSEGDYNFDTSTTTATSSSSYGSLGDMAEYVLEMFYS